MSMATVRLPMELEQKLALFSKVSKKSKSELIKNALELFFVSENTALDSYSTGKDLFGKYGSGDGNLSTQYKKRLKEKLNAKFRPD